MNGDGELLLQIERLGGSAFARDRAEWVRIHEEWRLHHQPIEVWFLSCALGTREVNVLVALLRRVPQLSVLKLNGSGLEESAIEELRRALPAVRVEVNNAL